MVSDMQIRILALTVLSVLLLPAAAFAQDADSVSCSYGELTRRVEIVREPGVAVPCEVHYYKDSEAPGDQQVLWRALNEAGFCEARAAEFVAKLEGWGWSCDGDAAAPEAEEAADDEMLGDAEEPESGG